MSFFKKKERPVIVVMRCPVGECTFNTSDEFDLKKHIEWKHPELKKNVEKIAMKSE